MFLLSDFIKKEFEKVPVSHMKNETGIMYNSLTLQEGASGMDIE